MAGFGRGLKSSRDVLYGEIKGETWLRLTFQERKQNVLCLVWEMEFYEF